MKRVPANSNYLGAPISLLEAELRILASFKTKWRLGLKGGEVNASLRLDAVLSSYQRPKLFPHIRSQPLMSLQWCVIS